MAPAARGPPQRALPIDEALIEHASSVFVFAFVFSAVLSVWRNQPCLAVSAAAWENYPKKRGDDSGGSFSAVSICGGRALLGSFAPETCLCAAIGRSMAFKKRGESSTENDG